MLRFSGVLVANRRIVRWMLRPQPLPSGKLVGGYDEDSSANSADRLAIVVTATRQASSADFKFCNFIS